MRTIGFMIVSCFAAFAIQASDEVVSLPPEVVVTTESNGEQGSSFLFDNEEIVQVPTTSGGCGCGTKPKE